jgi:hypothetical protein
MKMPMKMPMKMNAAMCSLAHATACQEVVRWQQPRKIIVIVGTARTAIGSWQGALHAMATLGARRGVASLCIGGGEATAIAIERRV